MGAGVKHYLPGTNEIPPLLLLPYLHDQVEQVPRLLQPPGIRFLVQRSVMSSFLATRQKTEPAVIASVARRRACGRTGWLRDHPSRVPLRFRSRAGHGRSFAQLSHRTPMTVRHLDTPSHGQCQVRSLTGAVHLQNNNGGVQRSAQCGQKPHAEHKDKSWLDLDVQYILRQRKLGLTILLV